MDVFPSRRCLGSAIGAWSASMQALAHRHAAMRPAAPYSRFFRGALQLDILARNRQGTRVRLGARGPDGAATVNGAHPLVCAVSLFFGVLAWHSGIQQCMEPSHECCSQTRCSQAQCRLRHRRFVPGRLGPQRVEYCPDRCAGGNPASAGRAGALGLGALAAFASTYPPRPGPSGWFSSCRDRRAIERANASDNRT